MNGGDALGGDGGHRLELGQTLQARLRLRRLAGLGAEAVDEALKVGALGLLLDARGGLLTGLLGDPALEIVVAAGVEVQLALAQVQDGVDRRVQQLAIVADDDGAVRILAQPRLEPHRAFEVEIVGRLVQKQQVRLGEQGGGQCHPHAPAAGELGHWAREVLGREAEPGQDLAGAGGGAVGVDLGQAVVDLGDPLGRCGLQLGIERVALRVGGQDGVEQARGRGRGAPGRRWRCGRRAAARSRRCPATACQG